MHLCDNIIHKNMKVMSYRHPLILYTKIIVADIIPVMKTRQTSTEITTTVTFMFKELSGCIVAVSIK